ncbi:MAG: ATPase, T2SS/T4P/T4SS family, partial [Thiovulaceae bacterium]|nr:ATPase, T2SS/T4P/T4SS family [Sulfurimonadaceae bacterium]
MIEQKPLGQFLLEEGIVTQKQIDVALSVQKIENAFLGETLQSLDFITSEEIAKAVAKQLEKEYVDIENSAIDAEVLTLVPKEIALSKKVLPLWIKDGTLYVAAEDTQDLVTSDYLLRTTKHPVTYVVCDKAKLYNMIELHYYQLENPIEKRIESFIENYARGLDIDVVALLDLLMHNALKDRATDIHITPDVRVVHVFFRIDGVLQHYYTLSKDVHAQMVARVKILSSIDIAEQRLPQDGAFSYQFLEQSYDFRASTLPTDQGENLVLRILAQTDSLIHLSALGLDEEDYQLLTSFFNKPYGMILVTGPTGSGKTTTLYSALQQIDFLSKNVLTVEDPIEYRFSFIKQTQINEKSGYGFAKAIRHFMRQDPDVLLVGEIRDQETAELAVRASITGHLVLSTLHANSAVATIPRLRDMGIA